MLLVLISTFQGFNRWLNREIEEQREREMMISLLDRVYTIVVFFITFGAIMIAFGISPTAVGAVLGGAGIGSFGTQRFLRTSCRG